MTHTKLKPFQWEGVLSMRDFDGRALLADEQGLGKTLQALTWIRKLPKLRPAIIVTPASLKYNWQAEAALHFGMRAEVLEGGCRNKRQKLPGDIVILNYDILHSWLPVLRRAKPRCVVFDEVHFCRHLGSRRTKAAIRLADMSRSVIGASGTPLLNRPIELWSVLRIVKPGLFHSRQHFAWRYCKPRYTPWGWRYDGSSNIPELKRILSKSCMIRRLKKDVASELPPKTRRPVLLKLKTYQEYHFAEEQFLTWLRRMSPAKARKAARNQALTKVGYLMRLAAKLKLPLVEQWIHEFFETHPGQKLVVLTMNTFVIDHLRERFGSRTVVINGAVTKKHRQEAVRRFQSSKRVDICLGNTKAAGLGLTLTSACHLAYLDLPWTPGDLLQGEDRVHRIGQKYDVTIHYLIALWTIEQKLLKMLHRKGQILSAVLDGTKATKDFDIFGQLLEELAHGQR